MSGHGLTPAGDDPALQRSLRRWMVAGAVILVIMVAAFPLYRAVDSSRRNDALSSQQSALVTSGQHLWSLNCAACHGDHGQGISAPALNSQQFLGSVTDEQILRIISAGISGTAMPAWSNEFGGPLTAQETAAIVGYLRSLQRKAPSVPDWRTRFVKG
ncbi:MAG TPA: c-type cytochrome [Actinomycetota bacterium]|nr:c-type cytochrome [Actinomycetota bacterium]